MRVILEATLGPAAGRKIVLRSQQSARIGRAQLADYAIPDDYLSSVHFGVFLAGEQCRLQDLGSSNGTFVNGKQVMEATLQTGDEITAGHSRFSVQIDNRSTLRPTAGRPHAADRTGRGGTESEGGAAAGSVVPPPEADLKPAPGRIQPAAAPRRPTALVEVPPRYERAFRDEDPDVREAALFAAVWTRQPWLFRDLSHLAIHPAADNLDALRMFAVLAEPPSLQTVLSIIRNTNLPPERFQVAGAFGHPGAVKDLLVAMSWKDIPAASQAAQAFEKITGAEIALVGAEEPSSDESEPEQAATPETLDAAPEATLAADVDQARTFWRNEQPRFSGSPRWSRGQDVSRAVSDEILRQLDLQSHWEVLLREHFHRRRDVRLADMQLIDLLV